MLVIFGIANLRRPLPLVGVGVVVDGEEAGGAGIHGTPSFDDARKAEEEEHGDEVEGDEVEPVEEALEAAGWVAVVGEGEGWGRGWRGGECFVETVES